ncbi:MAG: hypothetical protein ABIH63_03980, partial [archaeon]
MKRAILIILTLSLLISGCQTEKKLTQKEAEKLAIDKVYELTENKGIYGEGGPTIYKTTLEPEGDRWTIWVRANNTVVRTLVYQNGTIRVFPTI